MNNEQRGVALLIVLMLLALMAALAADMTISFHGQLHRTRQVNHHLQRQYDIELAEKLALASLTQDVKDNDRQTTLQQYWAQPQQLQLEDGNTVKWQLRDAQHCFNLNALAKISDDPLASPDFPAVTFQKKALDMFQHRLGGLILPAIHRSTNSTVERMISQIPVNSE